MTPEDRERDRERAQDLLRRFPPPPPTPEVIRKVAAIILLHAEDMERKRFRSGDEARQDDHEDVEET